MKWPTAQLGAVTKIVSGSTPKSGNPAFWGGSIPWATPTDLSGLTTKELASTGRKITEAGLASCSANMLPARSVLFSSRAPIGLVAINNQPLCTNQGFKSFVPDSSRLSPDFLYWWLKGNRPALEHLGRGATFKEVSKSIIEKVEIPLPPLAEQKRIAAILDAADALRTKRREALAQLDALLQSTFLTLFGDPVANPVGWEDEDGRKGWVRCVLGDQIKLQRGKDITKTAARPGIVPVISSGGTSFYHDTAIVSGPGVLLGRKGSVGKVHFTETDFWPHDTTLYVKEFKGNEPRFVFYFFKRFPIAHYEASVANPSLNRNNLHPVKVCWPPLPLQQKFAAIVESVEHQKVVQRAHLAALDALFAALQHRAFRGEL